VNARIELWHQELGNSPGLRVENQRLTTKTFLQL